METVEATFGFVDLAGFTALTEAHGDEQAVSLLGRFEAIAKAALGTRDRLVKTIGHAVMLAFADPDAAIDGTTRLFESSLAEAGMSMPRAGLHGEGRQRGIHVVDLGSFTLRNLTTPVELFELGLCPASAGITIDPVCRMQVPRASAAGRLRHDDTDYWFCSLECAATFAAQPTRFVAGTATGG